MDIHRPTQPLCKFFHTDSTPVHDSVNSKPNLERVSRTQVNTKGDIFGMKTNISPTTPTNNDEDRGISNLNLTKTDLNDVTIVKVNNLIELLINMCPNDESYKTTWKTLYLISSTIAILLPLPSASTGTNPSSVNGLSPVYLNDSRHCRNPARNPYDRSCDFCRGMDHWIKGCHLRVKYAEAGRNFFRGPHGRVFHTDGTPVGYHPGGIKAGLDQKWGGPLDLDTTNTSLNTGSLYEELKFQLNEETTEMNWCDEVMETDALSTTGEYGSDDEDEYAL